MVDNVNTLWLIARQRLAEDEGEAGRSHRLLLSSALTLLTQKESGRGIHILHPVLLHHYATLRHKQEHTFIMHFSSLNYAWGPGWLHGSSTQKHPEAVFYQPAVESSSDYGLYSRIENLNFNAIQCQIFFWKTSIILKRLIFNATSKM